MGTREKLIAKIESKPTRHDITLSEIKSYLEYFDFVQVRQNGSHRHFLHRESGKLITIVEHNGVVKASYVAAAASVVHGVD